MWFNVDKAGLAKILERRGKEFVVYELIQNAWDQRVTRVEVTLTKQPGSRWAELSVEDDDPDGFADLAHAWTLFAESNKKGNAEQRGRFNLGEKMVLAVCAEAEIISTTGGVRFDDQGDGRHRLRARRERGSLFRGRLKLTNEELAACCAAVDRLIPPSGIVTTFNGRELAPRKPLATVEASLKTEIADAEGFLRPATRKTSVRVYEPEPGEVGTLYELGIPVVETGDAYHADIGQKVPLNLDRDNVPPAYLRAVRALTLNAVHDRLSGDQANGVWVRDAFGSRDLSAEAVRSVVESRFGRKAVAYDPSDPEANKIAVVEGYTVVKGRQLSKDEWSHVRDAGALLPAGQVTPSNAQGGKTLQPIPRDQWTAAEVALIDRFHRIASALLGQEIHIDIVYGPRWLSCGKLVKACYGNGHLTINRAAHRADWWDGLHEDNLSLLIHELGHHYEADHLSRGYYYALSDLGARLALAAAADSGLRADMLGWLP